MRDLGFGRGRSFGLWLLYFVCGLGGFLGFLGCSIGRSSLLLTAIRGGPESKIVTEQLHDESAITVGLLGQ